MFSPIITSCTLQCLSPLIFYLRNLQTPRWNSLVWCWQHWCSWERWWVVLLVFCCQKYQRGYLWGCWFPSFLAWYDIFMRDSWWFFCSEIATSCYRNWRQIGIYTDNIWDQRRKWGDIYCCIGSAIRSLGDSSCIRNTEIRGMTWFFSLEWGCLNCTAREQ